MNLATRSSSQPVRTGGSPPIQSGKRRICNSYVELVDAYALVADSKPSISKGPLRGVDVQAVCDNEINYCTSYTLGFQQGQRVRLVQYSLFRVFIRRTVPPLYIICMQA